MIESWQVHQFFPDGDVPVSGTYQMPQLSERWLAVCESFLDQFGPVFNQDLGSTLSHFRIRMAGPVGELFAHDEVHFVFGLSRGQHSDQDRSSVDWFAKHLRTIVTSQGRLVAPEVESTLEKSELTPTFLLLDLARKDLDDDQKVALFQLGIHLAGAYFRWCGRNPQPDE